MDSGICFLPASMILQGEAPDIGMYIAFMPAIIFPIVITMFTVMIVKSRKLHELEIGQTPLYKGTCSAIIGGLRYTGPFIRIGIYEEFVVISYKKKIVLYYSDIDDIGEKPYSLMYKGLGITHHNPDAPKRIVLASISNNTIKRIMHEQWEKNNNPSNLQKK